MSALDDVARAAAAYAQQVADTDQALDALKAGMRRAVAEGLSVTKVAAAAGVARQTGHAWINEARAMA